MYFGVFCSYICVTNSDTVMLGVYKLYWCIARSSCTASFLDPYILLKRYTMTSVKLTGAQERNGITMTKRMYRVRRRNNNNDIR